MWFVFALDGLLLVVWCYLRWLCLGVCVLFCFVGELWDLLVVVFDCWLMCFCWVGCCVGGGVYL